MDSISQSHTERQPLSIAADVRITPKNNILLCVEIGNHSPEDIIIRYITAYEGAPDDEQLLLFRKDHPTHAGVVQIDGRLSDVIPMFPYYLRTGASGPGTVCWLAYIDAEPSYYENRPAPTVRVRYSRSTAPRLYENQDTQCVLDLSSQEKGRKISSPPGEEAERVDVEAIVKTIAQEYAPEKIILFGCDPREEYIPSENVDVDLLIIKETDKPFFDRVAQVRKILVHKFGYKYMVDAFVHTPSEVEHYLKQSPYSLVATALKEGKTLYERTK